MSAGFSRAAIGFGSVAEVAPRATVLPAAGHSAAPESSAVTDQTPFGESATPIESLAPAASTNGAGAEHVRKAIVAALATAGHSSAAQLLGAGEWKVDGTGVRVTAPGLGKKMLSLTVNSAAEKIIRQELQRLGAPSRFMVTAGAGIAPATALTSPAVGSVQEEALAHPLVKRAQEIFKAEVRSVVDLRQK
jgi:DNA polymerase-3 subunit gamma/tau